MISLMKYLYLIYVRELTMREVYAEGMLPTRPFEGDFITELNLSTLKSIRIFDLFSSSLN